MFLIEIQNNTKKNQLVETFIVNKKNFNIGVSSDFYVDISKLSSKNVDLEVNSSAGNTFDLISNNKLLEKYTQEYENEAICVLGDKEQILIKRLYNDLLKFSNSKDLLIKAISKNLNKFPLINVNGKQFESFSFEKPIIIGRSADCDIQIKDLDISAKHVEVLKKDGRYYVQDLGSTNGAYIDMHQVSGKIYVEPGIPILLGRKNFFIIIDKEIDLQHNKNEIMNVINNEEQNEVVEDNILNYPLLISLSDVVRPLRSILKEGNTLVIGRDPESDVWIGAPHVSRSHAKVFFDGKNVVFKDLSTNGTSFGEGRTSKGEDLNCTKSAKVFNFGGGITLALIFNENQLREFITKKGAEDTFLSLDMKELLEEQKQSEYVDNKCLESYKQLKLENLKNISFKELFLSFYKKGLMPKILILVGLIAVFILIFIISSIVISVLNSY